MKCAEAGPARRRRIVGRPSRRMLDFSRLATPAAHGDVLIEPAAEGLVELAHRNRSLISGYPFEVLGLTVGEVRARLRARVCDGCDGPVIVTGHQPEFIHAGVWAKHVVASALAKAMGSKAVNLVVDSDAPVTTTLAVPVVEGDRLTWGRVSYASLAGGVSHDAIGRMDGARVRSLADEVAGLMGDRYASSNMPAYFEGILGADDATDWVEQMVMARRAVEHRLGVEMFEHCVGRVWGMPLLPEMMLNAGRFVDCYNGALADYRGRYGERNPSRPVPDLGVGDGRFELPVWAYRTGERRRRLFVTDDGDRIGLFADDEMIGNVGRAALSSWKSAEEALGLVDGFVFRPRALSLTLWARLFVGDLFIHGIGGAKYDRVTDELVRRFYGVEPPAMACVSATMWFDGRGDAGEAVEAVETGAVREAERRVRDVRWNSQRHVGSETGLADSAAGVVAGLIEERSRAVADSERLRRARSRDRTARREVFRRIRDVNDRLLAMEPGVVDRAAHDLTVVRELADAARSRTNREFFFAMLDTSSLEQLRDRLTQSAVFRV